MGSSCAADIRVGDAAGTAPHLGRRPSGRRRGDSGRRAQARRQEDWKTPMNVRLQIAFVAVLASVVSIASRAAPSDPSTHFDAGSKAFSSGDYAAAAAAFEAARAAGMTGPAVEYNAGVSYYRLGDYSRAEDSFRGLAHSYPQMTPLAEYNLGLALLKQQRFNEAQAAFARARDELGRASRRGGTEGW